MFNDSTRNIRTLVPTLTAALGLCVAPAVGLTAAEPSADANAPDLLTALTEGKTGFKIRPRYEHVDVDNATDDADALTVKVALDYTTGRYWDMQAFIGFETTQTIGEQRYNDGVDDPEPYQTVADPDHAELNLFGIKYLGLEDTQFILGRQRIIHDNARFVGNVGWRQNEQTFDALTVKYSGVENLTIDYSLVMNVNRIFGEDGKSSSDFASGQTADDQMIGNLALGQYKLDGIGTASAYAYVLDYEDKDALDSGTFGLRFTGAYGINDDLSVVYAAALAHQSDMFDNDNDHSELYYNAEVGVKWKGLTAKIGYEVLGGDGETSFQTPLATLHAYNGWADKFLGTPANGLTDLYVMVGGAIPQVDGLTAKAFYHIFESDEGNVDYGSEFDLVVVYALKSIDPKWKIGGKLAVYSADDYSADTTKFWLWTEWGF